MRADEKKDERGPPVPAGVPSFRRPDRGGHLLLPHPGTPLIVPRRGEAWGGSPHCGARTGGSGLEEDTFG
ncbi:hypothetical protein GCM10009716_04720 [Streptomyces sodiiphilus]|uniref:Uncharacterized protein n=1 Tax=Streptomyces sodiiphilus TaxID=226217 RepID=A0ABN2NSF6_9ACTN